MTAKVFNIVGTKVDGNEVNVVIQAFDEFQKNLLTLMDDLVKRIADSYESLESAKKNATGWANSLRYQVSLKHHYTSAGPNIQGVRWGFENSIKYIIISATELADEGGNDTEFKKMVSDYVKNVVIQSLIDTLETIKNKLDQLKQP
ncbi:Hypothetical protein CINCED_3A020848 [Cinara cedri]|nr:Hypothetical protein CINCED_3A020848 [Cinara cedri]